MMAQNKSLGMSNFCHITMDFRVVQAWLACWIFPDPRVLEGGGLKPYVLDVAGHASLGN